MPERRDVYDAERMLICPPPGTGRAAIEALLAEDFVETGTSGRIRTRAAGLETLMRRSAAPPETPWEISGFETRALSETILLATYMLAAGSRVTRRATIWRREGGAWRAVYHQGTVWEEA